VGGEQTGAPVDPRLFPGGGASPRGPELWTKTLEVGWWPISKNAAAFRANQHGGVMVALQPAQRLSPDGPAETIRVIGRRGVPTGSAASWISGSLRSGDPYAEIEKLVPYAVFGGRSRKTSAARAKDEPTDLAKIKAIIRPFRLRRLTSRLEGVGREADPAGVKVATFPGEDPARPSGCSRRLGGSSFPGWARGRGMPRSV